jgi:uncharacterized membrane protein YhaH (DUF805 family)
MKTKLFSFNGRSNRGAYWAVSFVSFFILAAAVTVLDAVFPGVGEGPSNVALVTMCILLLPLGWIGLAVQIRRCHDQNRSGWIMLFGLIPYIGAICLVLVLGLVSGTAGENDYGIEPD